MNLSEKNWEKLNKANLLWDVLSKCGKVIIFLCMIAIGFLGFSKQKKLQSKNTRIAQKPNKKKTATITAKAKKTRIAAKNRKIIKRKRHKKKKKSKADKAKLKNQINTLNSQIMSLKSSLVATRIFSIDKNHFFWFVLKKYRKILELEIDLLNLKLSLKNIPNYSPYKEQKNACKHITINNFHKACDVEQKQDFDVWAKISIKCIKSFCHDKESKFRKTVLKITNLLSKKSILQKKLSRT